jgi:hypothetical protein
MVWGGTSKESGDMAGTRIGKMAPCGKSLGPRVKNGVFSPENGRNSQKFFFSKFFLLTIFADPICGGDIVVRILKF